MDDLLKKVKGFSPLQLGLGLLAGVILSPLVLFIFWSIVVPLVVLVVIVASFGVLAAIGSARHAGLHAAFLCPA